MDNNLKNSSSASKSVRERLAGKTGKQYWRCLEELADTDEFREFLMDEIPQQTRAMDIGIDRRRFLTLAGASLAMAGLSGCRWLPQKKIVPYVEMPEDLVISEPLYYASSILQHGVATGVIVTSRDGRPVRIEGNPDHPGSLGGNSSLVQAEILNLYDPDRSQAVINQGDVSSWPEFRKIARQALQDSKNGAGVRILTGTVTSPTLKSQLDALRKSFPDIIWHQYEPNARHNANAAARQAFGAPLNTIYDLTKADVILSLDSDILFDIPGHIRYSRDFASRRRVRTAAISADQPANMTMSRIYAVESGTTVTGATADHRLAVRATDVATFAAVLAQQLGATPGAATVLPASIPQTWVNTLISDLTAKPGASLVVAGEHQPPVVHLIAHAINAKLGNVGKTVLYTESLEAEPTDQRASIKALTDDMASGAVKALFIIGGNPVYDTPVDLEFGRNLPKVPLSVHLAEHEDETSLACTWHLPQTHMLEAWSDARAYDGTLSIVQPLIQPLYESARSTHEFLSSLSLTSGELDGYDIVYGYWKANRTEADFERWWQITLHDGLIRGSALPTRQPTLNPAALATIAAPPAPPGLEIVFRFDPTIDDGRFANNGWMQELPKPLTKLTWDNAAIMSTATAEKLGFFAHNGIVVAAEKMITIAYQGRKLKIPVLPTPGHADDSMTISFGYGRTRGGKILEATGFNAYSIFTSDCTGIGSGIQAELTDDTYSLTHTRSHHSMEGRDIIMESTLADYQKNPTFAKIDEVTQTPIVDPVDASGNGTRPSDTPGKPTQLTLYDNSDFKYGDKMTPEGLVTSETGAYAYHWGLSIDNNICIGCNACVTACQSENNIPVVGKDQVQRGREMLWIRIDRYYRGPISNPHTFFEPVPCMHCENAPCEPVCPVAATVHSAEGLNQMVYNRCVGTRYCSNNCPYKVRRFNFYKFVAGQPDPDHLNGNFDSPVLKLMANPEVTVRGRGVMEKCSYCVQRINAARITAKKEIRPIKDGEIVTACQQSCPTGAIVFGNIADPNSAVSKLKAEPTDYSVLADLNTRPRTTYLAHLRNPNPAIIEDTIQEPDTPVME